MIITLVKANFSGNNIGTLSTWTVTKQFESGVTLTSPSVLNSIDKEGTTEIVVTITVDITNYTLDNAKVYMGGADVSSDWSLAISDGTITFTIPAGNTLTGNITIDVDTTKISGGDTGGSESTTPDENGIITLSNFSVATQSDGTTKYLKAEDSCVVMAFNVETNTNYTVIDTGAHNRFRFYGRTTKDSASDMVANLVFDGIIVDQNSTSNIDSWYDYTFNSGEYQTVYVYLATSSNTGTPSLTVTKQTGSTAVNMLQSRAFKTVENVKTLYQQINCLVAAINVTTNTDYKIVDSGTHNRFRFYGRTASDDVVTMHTNLLAMDGIIADNSTDSIIDSLSEYTINSGSYQTIYIYLVAESTNYTPNITIAEV